MTRTTWTSAPAGACGSTAEVPGGTGDVALRLPSRTGASAVRAGTGQPATQRSIDQRFTRNDGTTLGIHPPRGPRS